jgi:arginine exporter protein ArgO
LALAQALSSPALLTLVGILALLYVGFVAVKMAMKRRKQARKCRDCEHEAHGGGRCRNRYCRCDE